MIVCDVCGDEVCKYELDFNATGAVAIWVNDEQDEKVICNECAKKIAKELIDQ